MNLCIVCTEFPPEPHGGTGSSYHDLAHGLAGAGHSASVIARSSRGLERKIHVEQQGAIEVTRLPRPPAIAGTRLGGWLERRQILRAMRRLHTQNAFTHVEASDYDGLLSYGGLRGIPAIVRIRGSNLFFDTELGRPPQIYEHAQERAAFRRATHLASVSRYAAEKTLALCGMSNRPCTILPNGVDTELFSPDSTVKPEPGLVVYVNSLNPKKGIEQLIDACNAAFPSRPGTKLAVIGEDTQRHLGGAYLVRLRERVHPALRDRVDFLGRLPRESIVEWLRRAAIACYPSHMETFGIAALEAMSVGRPTIFSRRGPGPELIQDGETGLLCDPRDVADLARVLSQLLDDTEAAEALGRRGRARVLSDFDKRGWIARNVAFFKSCYVPPN